MVFQTNIIFDLILHILYVRVSSFTEIIYGSVKILIWLPVARYNTSYDKYVSKLLAILLS